MVNWYFENFENFLPYRQEIKSWFSVVEKTNTTDLVFHFRTGDRLFMKNEFDYKPSAKDYSNAISKFSFDKLHIVSDLPELKIYNKNELMNTKFHASVSTDAAVSIDASVLYLNSIITEFKKYDVVFEKASVKDDFNKIRSFNNILFEHGTMSWWAAFLSDAQHVGVYGPWRQWKGSSNKNLSKIPLAGWFSWE